MILFVGTTPLVSPFFSLDAASRTSPPRGRCGAFLLFGHLVDGRVDPVENDTADIVAPLIEDCCCIWEMLAMIEDVGVHQVMGLLLGSAATS
jgi:hypothetical protein